MQATHQSAENGRGFYERINLTGAGDVYMRDSVATIATGSAFTLTNGVNQTNHGRGAITAAVTNQGTIRSDQASPLVINPVDSGVRNDGRMEVTGTGGMTINAAALFENMGVVVVNESSELTANGGYRQTDGITTVNGTLDVNADPVELYGGTLQGEGVVQGDVINAGGSVAPGNSAGMLTIQGTFAQAPAGVLMIELSGMEPGTGFDTLVISGTVSLAGTLQVSLSGGFQPPLDATFEVISAGSVSGTFDTVVGAGDLRVVYGPESVILTACDLGDFDCGGAIDLSD